MTHEFRYVGTGDGLGTVNVDGQDISRQTVSFSVDAKPRTQPVVTIELAAARMQLDFPQTSVQLSEDTKTFLHRIGWTPPGRYEELRDVAACVVTGEAVLASLHRVLADQGWTDLEESQACLRQHPSRRLGVQDPGAAPDSPASHHERHREGVDSSRGELVGSGECVVCEQPWPCPTAHAERVAHDPGADPS